ncbi:MAG: acetolactate synthase small subunit [Bacteroidales bacterium]|nr:acetolactate synthase small subunit [Bacteroidales bacterium]
MELNTKIQEFTLSVFTENTVGMLNRVTIIFTRRKLNIESITASNTELKDIYRYTIVVKTTLDMIKKVTAQLEKQIDIHKALFYTSDQVIYNEIALYKMPMTSDRNYDVEAIVRQNHARILSVTSEYMVIEKTGLKEETQALYDLLKMHGLLEFARSGRVAVTRPMRKLNSFLDEMEAKTNYDTDYN